MSGEAGSARSEIFEYSANIASPARAPSKRGDSGATRFGTLAGRHSLGAGKQGTGPTTTRQRHRGHSSGLAEGRDSLEPGDGADTLIIDDLVDTGNTAKLVREMLPKAHFATVYAKPAGRPMVDTFVTEVSQNTWIHFPWDLSLQFARPIAAVD